MDPIFPAGITSPTVAAPSVTSACAYPSSASSARTAMMQRGQTMLPMRSVVCGAAAVGRVSLRSVMMQIYETNPEM